MVFKIEGKAMYPISIFAKCSWSIHSKVISLSKHSLRTATREKPLAQKLCCFTSRLCTCPSSSASI